MCVYIGYFLFHCKNQLIQNIFHSVARFPVAAGTRNVSDLPRYCCNISPSFPNCPHSQSGEKWATIITPQRCGYTCVCVYAWMYICFCFRPPIFPAHLAPSDQTEEKDDGTITAPISPARRKSQDGQAKSNLTIDAGLVGCYNGQVKKIETCETGRGKREVLWYCGRTHHHSVPVGDRIKLI